jgi:hypothetical protein
MKDLQTGEITPPLPHDEYMEEFQKNVEAERREKAKAAKGRGRAAAPPADDEEEEEEPEFAGNPLSFYDGKSDEEIDALPGVGEKTLKDIRAAQKARDARK